MCFAVCRGDSYWEKRFVSEVFYPSTNKESGLVAQL